MLIETFFPRPPLTIGPEGSLQLRQSIIDQQDFFTQQCPQCRSPQVRPPVTFPALNAYIAFLKVRLENYGLPQPELAEQFLPQCFLGLFPPSIL